jgi:flagellar basal body-associated protein FliL
MATLPAQNLQGRSLRRRNYMDLIWIIIIVLVVLALLGYFGRGRFR